MARATALTLRNGDLLQVSRLKPTLDSGVKVEGYVHSPAIYAYRDGLRLSSVIRSVDELRPNADIHYVLIRRETPLNRELSVVSADLGAALNAPGSDADVELKPRDRIVVFDLETSRERIIRPLMNELRTQASFQRPTEVVSVDGKVKVPGEYPLEPGMKVSDLIRAGGNLGDAAYGGQGRSSPVIASSTATCATRSRSPIDLTALVRGDPAANVELQPFDSLSIREVPEWGAQEHVTLQGEVRFPGRYSIKRGDTLRSVIERAGGLTEFAFPEGSVFTREELKGARAEAARRAREPPAERSRDAGSAGRGGEPVERSGTALSVGQSLLTQLRSSDAVGRLVIDLPRAMRSTQGRATTSSCATATG